MAELDDKLLKNLDKTLEDMTTHLTGIETALKGVKNGLESTFNPAILKSFSDELRGMKAARLIDAEDNVSQVNKIYSAIQEFDRRVKTGTKLEFLSEAQIEKYKQELDEIERKLDAVAGKRLKGQEWLDRRALYERRDMLRDIVTSDQPTVSVPLSTAELKEAVELLKRYKEIFANITKGEQQRAVELANITAKERKADMKSADDALAQTEQEERKKFEIERAWNEKSTKEAEQREKMKTAAEKAAADERIAIEEAEVKKKSEIEMAWADHVGRRYEKDGDPLGEIAARKGLTGTLAALEDQTAVNEWRKQTAEEQKRIAKETAAIQKKADAESMANQRRQIQIKSQLAAIDKNRISITKQSSDREKALATQQQADYRSLQSELSKLIARQKELNAVSQGSGRRAKDRLSTYTISESEKAMRRYADAVRNAHREQKKLGDETDKMLPTLQRLASAFGVAFSIRGLAQFGKKLIETRGEFELQQVALRYILQNKQLADEIWDKTMRAALQSPFTAMQLTKYTKQLAAYRIETEKLFDTTKRLADVSAGLGVDMQRLILAYGQVKAANYLRASEIRQFTEAGVNILGELSQYFTETREGMYSTAQVMDMVQKRMVKFEDVEAIFKRMTDQGGIFYNMQYVQSQTIKGQMMKLKDAFDQMLNSIGQGNEGVIKNLIAAMNNMVQNWRTWAVVLKSIGWAAALGYMSKFVFQLNGITKASTATLKSFAKLKMGLQDLGKALRTNWLSLVVAGVTALLTAMVSLNRRMKEINREIDEQNLRLYETRQNFKDMKSKIEANNTALKNQTSDTESLNKAQKENESIMQKLRNEYPQLAEQMSIATNGIIDMNGALDANIRKLNEQMTILNAMKQGNWIVDSDQKNLTDWQSALATMRTTLLAAQSEARRQVLNMELREGGTEDPLYAKLKEFADQELPKDILKAVEAFKKLNGEVLAYQANLFMGTPTRPESLYSMLGIKAGNLQANWSYDRVTEVLDKFTPALQSFYENGIKDNADFLKTINEQYGGDVTQFVKENAEKINKATIDGLNTANDVLINTLKPQTEEMRVFLNQELNKRFGTSGIDFFSKSTKDTTTETDEDKQNKIDAAWRRRINLLEEMKKRYDELSKSAYGYAMSASKVRSAFDDSFKEIFKGTGISMSQIDFTSMQGMFDSMRLALSKASGISDAVREEIMKKIDSYEARIEIDAQVRVREDFAREIEKMFSDYELTLELQKLNISPSAAKNLFPELGYKTMGDLQDRMRRFYQEQVEAGGFDEKDLETYRKFADKIDAEILKERKERAKQYSKFLEQEYSERAKVEMQYAQDVAFVTTNFEGTQRENILKGLQQKFSKDISELNWKSFKESDFYLDMMEDLSSLPKDYLDMMLKKIEQVLTKNKDGLSPRTLKEIVKARQRVLDAQIKLRPLDVMRSSIEGIRAASKDETVGGGTWRATNKNLKENIKLQADQIAQFDEEILSLQKLQGELAGYEEQTARFKAISSRIDLGVLNSLLGLGEDESIADVGTMEISDIKELIERLTAGLNAAKKAYDPAQKTDEMNKLAVEISQREIMIKLLGEELEIRREMSEYQLSPQAVDAMEQGQTSAGIGAQISEVAGKKETTEKRQLKFKEWLKSFDNFGEAYKELNKNINNTITSVANAGSAFYDMFKALGGETDALTEGWKEFGSTMISTITQALTMIPTMVTAFVTAGTAINAALGIIGLIAEALQLLFVAIGAIAKLHDSQYEKEIEEQQKRIDELKRAYDRLDKSIEKTWDTMSYIRDYNDMIYNLEQQRDALNKQIAAEEKKKDTDSDKLQGYKDSIQEIDDQLEELKQKQIEVFGGLGEVNYRSAAQEFVSAWKDAFLETGDGLEGLQDHFDEFLQEWFVKQATMRVAGRMLEPLFRQIDNAVDQYGTGGTSVLLSELQAIREKFAQMAPDISANLEALAGTFGLGEGEGGLSGLAAGIQGMSEEQANILEAYWNSVRMYTASIDMNVTRIAEMLGAGSKDITNPQLQQLELIAHNTASIQRMFESVVQSGHTRGQSGIRVFVD